MLNRDVSLLRATWAVSQCTSEAQRASLRAFSLAKLRQKLKEWGLSSTPSLNRDAKEEDIIAHLRKSQTKQAVKATRQGNDNPHWVSLLQRSAARSIALSATQRVDSHSCLVPLSFQADHHLDLLSNPRFAQLVSKSRRVHLARVRALQLPVLKKNISAK